MISLRIEEVENGFIIYEIGGLKTYVSQKESIYLSTTVMQIVDNKRSKNESEEAGKKTDRQASEEKGLLINRGADGLGRVLTADQILEMERADKDRLYDRKPEAEE